MGKWSFIYTLDGQAGQRIFAFKTGKLFMRHPVVVKFMLKSVLACCRYGDIKGIHGHMNYLKDIGVKIIILSDVVGKNDFRDFKRKENTLSHFEELVRLANNRGISVVLEMDPTYTEASSDWFRSSSMDNSSVYNDWYIWRKSQNNWENKAGGKAWKFDVRRRHYYYYYLDVNKPALNFNNTGVRKEFKDALTHWMAKGVKGFKLKNFQRLIVDESFNDNPSSKTIFYDKG